MYRIAKRFTFDAAHRLEGLPVGHKCSRMHGHTYTVEVVLAADALTVTGMVLDYGELARLRDWINATWDHRTLNECFPFGPVRQPTAENMAAAVFDLCVDWCWPVVEVRVSETPNTWASYSEPG